MNHDFLQMLDLLFDEHEKAFVSDSKFAYHSVDLSIIRSGEVTLVSPNPDVPIKKVDSDKLILVGINPAKHGFRNDENVEIFRTFLWEIDVGDIPSQIQYVKQLNLPISACVFSGNKSAHFVTVLSQPIPNEKAYRYLYQWGLNIGTLFDAACKNPSRAVRMAGTVRPNTGKEQKLLELNGRIDRAEFLNWLNQYPNCKPRTEEKRSVNTTGCDFNRIKPWAIKLLQDPAGLKTNRNNKWFSLSVELTLAGYSSEDVVSILEHYFEEDHDFKRKEWLFTVRSGIKHAMGKYG